MSAPQEVEGGCRPDFPSPRLVSIQRRVLQEVANELRKSVLVNSFPIGYFDCYGVWKEVPRTTSQETKHEE